MEIEYDEECDEKANESALIRNRILQISSINEMTSTEKDEPLRVRSQSAFSARALLTFAALNGRRRSMADITNLSAMRTSNQSSFLEGVFSGHWIKREPSMTDISHQTEEQDIFIRMNSEDTISNALCPMMSWCFAGIYVSNVSILIVIALAVVGFYTDWWLFSLLNLIGFLMVMDYPLMKFMLCHSIELYLMELCGIIACICNAVLELEEIHGLMDWFHVGTRFMTGIIGIFVCECLDGYRGPHLVKFSILMLGIAVYARPLVEPVITGSDRDKKVLMPIVEQTFSVHGLMVVAAFNVMMLFLNRIFLQMKYRGHIHIATYPNMVWVQGDHEQLRESIRSGQERQLSRTLTFSLDIYKQSLTQKVEIFLHEEKDVNHLCLRPRIASRLRFFHFSKANLSVILLLFFAILVASHFEMAIVSIMYEIVVIVLLLIGAGTFNVKMTQHYLSTFDFYYKLGNWMWYCIADAIWTTYNMEMTDIRWIDYILIQCILSIIILYIICIDSYHISHRVKVRALSILIGGILYYQCCLFAQRYSLNPTVSWENRDLVVPVIGVSITLKTLLINPLVGLTLFIGKQLVTITLHPNQAMLEVYPRIDWVGEGGTDDLMTIPEDSA